MGEEFDSKRMIMIGVMGSRIVGLSADDKFLENLPTGADTDLKGLAAQISTYLNRFPDWLDYIEDAQADGVSAEAAKDEAKAFAELAAELTNTEEVDAEVSGEFKAETTAAMASDSDAAIATGLLASTRELARVISEKALAGVKSGEIVRTSIDVMDDVADAEFAKMQFWSYGWTLVLLKRKQAPLRRLSERFPSRLGWLGPVLDYLVGKRQE